MVKLYMNMLEVVAIAEGCKPVGSSGGLPRSFSAGCRSCLQCPQAQSIALRVVMPQSSD